MKKNITLNKKVCYICVVLLFFCINFSIKSYNEKAALDKKAASLPLDYSLSVIDTWRKEDCEKNSKTGFILSLVTGGIIYLTSKNIIDLDMIVKNNKKKIKKRIAKKLKHVLEEE